jgi:hypothetical protein
LGCPAAQDLTGLPLLCVLEAVACPGRGNRHELGQRERGWREVGRKEVRKLETRVGRENDRILKKRMRGDDEVGWRQGKCRNTIGWRRLSFELNGREGGLSRFSASSAPHVPFLKTTRAAVLAGRRGGEAVRERGRRLWRWAPEAA